MSEQALTTEETKYFETKGATAPVVETPADKAAPDPAEGKQPETRPEPAAETKTEQAEKQTVPLATLLEERNEAKRLKSELAQLRETVNKGNQRLEQFFQAQQPKEELPAADVDPVARIDKRLDNIDGSVKKFIEGEQTKQAINGFVSAVKSHEEQFLKTTPDYYDALAHLRAQRIEERMMFGEPENVARQNVAQEELLIAKAALEAGDSPARRAYEAATRRGYAKKAAAEKPDPAKTLETVAKGQEAAASLAASPGGAKPVIDLVALSKMDDDDFNKFASDPKKWRKVWGD